jgi:hypothetical protein
MNTAPPNHSKGPTCVFCGQPISLREYGMLIQGRADGSEGKRVYYHQICPEKTETKSS